MEVVPVAVLAPSICFLCELRPTEAQVAVDTKKEFFAGGPCYLNGRRYVCEGCAMEIARVMGFVKSDAVDAMIVENDELRQQVSAMKDRAKQIAEQILGEQPIAPKVKTPAKRAKENVQKD